MARHLEEGDERFGTLKDFTARKELLLTKWEKVEIEALLLQIQPLESADRWEEAVDLIRPFLRRYSRNRELVEKYNHLMSMKLEQRPPAVHAAVLAGPAEDRRPAAEVPAVRAGEELPPGAAGKVPRHGRVRREDDRGRKPPRLREVRRGDPRLHRGGGPAQGGGAVPEPPGGLPRRGPGRDPAARTGPPPPQPDQRRRAGKRPVPPGQRRQPGRQGRVRESPGHHPRPDVATTPSTRSCTPTTSRSRPRRKPARRKS